MMTTFTKATATTMTKAEVTSTMTVPKTSTTTTADNGETTRTPPGCNVEGTYEGSATSTLQYYEYDFFTNQFYLARQVINQFPAECFIDNPLNYGDVTETNPFSFVLGPPATYPNDDFTFFTAGPPLAYRLHSLE